MHYLSCIIIQYHVLFILQHGVHGTLGYKKARYLSLDDSTVKRYVSTYKLPLAVMLQRGLTLKGEPGPWWPP